MFPDLFVESVSCTTRDPRPGEVDGTHYHFISMETFDKMLEEGEFIEYVQFGGNKYGTPKKEIERINRLGKVPLMEIIIHSATQIYQNQV